MYADDTQIFSSSDDANELVISLNSDLACKKASAAIDAMKRIKPFVPMHTLEFIYKSLVQPYFDYYSPLWDTCGKLLRDNLQRFQSRAARVLTGANYDTPQLIFSACFLGTRFIHLNQLLDNDICFLVICIYHMCVY